MGSFNFRNTNMVSLAYVPEVLTDDVVQEIVAENYPEWFEDDAALSGGLRLSVWYDRLRDMEWDDMQELTHTAEMFGRALRDELGSRFPFHSVLSAYCSDWSWSFDVCGGYYEGIQMVLRSRMMDNLFEPVSNGLSGSCRKQWDYLYELVVDIQEFSGVTRQDFGAILDKVWRFANYALTKFGMANGFSGALGSWVGSTYTLPAYDDWAKSEKEKSVFVEWYRDVMRSYEYYCRQSAV